MLHVEGKRRQYGKRGIFNGDQILVQQQNTANNGDMVVALIDDSATVKTFYKEDGHYRLQPENDSMSPIIVDEVTILGKVLECFGYFNHIRRQSRRIRTFFEPEFCGIVSFFLYTYCPWIF